MDHTYGTGFGNYLHMDGSDMQSGQRAILRSPLIDGQVHPDGDCFQFWFFLHYYDTGLIRVNLISEDGTNEQLIEIQGDMGPTWRTERLPIISKSPYRVRRKWFHSVIISLTQIEIYGIAAGNEDGDIGLDDLSLTYEPCNNPLSCTFESGDTCSWTNSRAGGAPWLLTAGKTPSPDTGPSTDHTTGTGSGFYLYAEASYMFGDYAMLESEAVIFDKEICVQLYFHMWGGGIGK